MEYVPCIGNSSYSFWWILLKLYRCFKDGLEICILIFQNPEIIFYHFFRIFNIDIFRALILQICIWSIYLVSATPPTVFGESFWNFTVVLRMVWRYAYCFLRILKLFFLHFNLDIFSSLYATDMYREYMPCIGNPAYSFRPILLKLYRYFAGFLWFHMRNLSLAGYNCSGGASCMAWSFIGIWNVALFRPQIKQKRNNELVTAFFSRSDTDYRVFLILCRIHHKPIFRNTWFQEHSVFVHRLCARCHIQIQFLA